MDTALSLGLIFPPLGICHYAKKPLPNAHTSQSVRLVATKMPLLRPFARNVGENSKNKKKQNC